MTALHPSCQAVNDILAAAGLPGRVRILGDAAPTARAAAEQIGCPVGAIANSLIFATDASTPLLIMTSGAHRVDVAKVGLELHEPAPGLRRIRPGAHRPADRRRRSDRHPRPIRTLVDVALAEFDELWAAGGIRMRSPISSPTCWP